MLVRQPDVIDNHLFMRTKTLDNLAGFPIPENDITTSCTTRDVFPIRTESDITGVTSGSVTCETLLFSLFE